MGFTRFVEIGRVGLISYGPDTGKLCTIVNVIDHNRVLVDGPETLTGVRRHELNLKRLMLTDLKVDMKLNATQKHAAAPPTPRLCGARQPRRLAGGGRRVGGPGSRRRVQAARGCCLPNWYGGAPGHARDTR